MNIKLPLITVIMPIYNSQRTLEESIKSILQQSFKNFELILIDDASNDNSKTIIKKYANLDSRIIPIYSKQNLGVGSTLNKGLKTAKGKYIAIQDSDDYSHKNRLEEEYNYLEKYKKIFLVGSSINKVDLNRNLLYKTHRINLPSFLIKLYLLFTKSLLAHSTVMFRNEKKYFYKPNIRSAIDYYFYLNLMYHNKKFKNISKILVDYTYNHNGISMQKSFEQKIEEIHARNYYILKKIFNKKIDFKLEDAYFEKLKQKYSRLELKLKIRNYYRLENIQKGNKCLKLYIYQYKRIPIKYLILSILSIFNKNIIKRA
ncbi:MAG: glycosyltransferase family 2 protein [Nanoarchaeota archaeon]